MNYTTVLNKKGDSSNAVDRMAAVLLEDCKKWFVKFWKRMIFSLKSTIWKGYVETNSAKKERAMNTMVAI